MRWCAIVYKWRAIICEWRPTGRRPPCVAGGASGRQEIGGGWCRVCNMAIPGNNRERYYNSSVADCQSRCSAQPWCKSFDFQRKNRVCMLQDVNADDIALARQPGSPFDHYVRNCGSRGVSGSRISTARPAPNRPADASAPRRSTDRWCSAPNLAIPGNNQENHYNKDVDDCKALCSERSWCRSFDYQRKNRVCMLQSVTVREVALARQPGNPFDHYTRDCASIGR